MALVPIGYGDGVFRALGNRGHVLINGRRYPLVGRISMDSFGGGRRAPTAECKVGDTVTLIGPTATSASRWRRWPGGVGTINYEITCDIALDRSERLPQRQSDLSPGRASLAGAAGRRPHA